jgi:hypothetical protein
VSRAQGRPLRAASVGVAGRCRAGWLGLFTALSLAALVLAGCATVDSRIRQNTALFATYSPEVQAKIRAGRIEVGFTREMVEMALGPPDRVFKRLTAEGETVIWTYVDRYYWTDYEPVERGYWYRDHRGRLHWAPDWTWMGVTRRDETVALRVEFEDGKVKAIESRRD